MLTRRSFFKTITAFVPAVFSFRSKKVYGEGDVLNWLRKKIGIDEDKVAAKKKIIPGPKMKHRIVISAKKRVLTGKYGKPDRMVIKEMLFESVRSLRGLKSYKEAWRSMFRNDDVVGIKLNCLAGRGLSPSREMVDAIIDGLRMAGVPDEQIIIWDRNDEDLRSAGYSIKRSRSGGVRCLGTDADYDQMPEIKGAIGSCFSRIISNYCSAIINVPVLKDHDLAGLSLGMKNFYGVIHNPNKYHDNNCNPYVADLNSHHFIKDKLRLIVCDALKAQYHGGPAYKPQWVWNFEGIIVGNDPVAIDKVGYDIIDRKRAEMGMKSLKEAEREPKYIKRADEIGLGTSDPSKIEIVSL